MQGKQPPKKGLLSPKRVMEIADSVETGAYAYMRAGSNKMNKAKTTIEKEGAEQLSNSGYNELKKSERYRSLAENAMKAIALKNKKK